jgi:thioredoxin-related protein
MIFPKYIFRVAVLILGMSIVPGAVLLGQANGKGSQSGISFKQVAVPDTLRSTGERASFLALHYWDTFDFGDTACVHAPDVTDQALVNFVFILPYASAEAQTKGIDTLLSKAQVNDRVFGYFTALLDRYLYEPNSPLYNEELYIPVLRYLLASPKVDSLRKSTYDFRLSMALKNRKGTKATDIVYGDVKGKKHTLWTTATDRRTLLVFFDPECEHCVEIIGKLRTEALLKEQVDSGQLAILAIYAEGNKEAWEKAKTDMPDGWLIGCDRSGIRKHTLYDLKAMPTFYLLDKDKTVILKDANVKEIFGVIGKR